MATLTKIAEERANPNGINIGMIREIGITPRIPVKGDCYMFGTLLTTPIEDIISMKEGEIVFKTINSTYKLIY